VMTVWCKYPKLISALFLISLLDMFVRAWECMQRKHLRYCIIYKCNAKFLISLYAM
jgi:hypothetical protein